MILTNRIRTRREMREATTPLEDLAASFLRAKKAEGRAEDTLDWYAIGIGGFILWLRDNGRQGALADLDPEVARAYIAHRMEVGVRGRGSMHQARSVAVPLKSWASFLADDRIWHDAEGESVLKRVRVPRARPDNPRRPLSDEQVRRVLAAAAEGRDGSRDLAIVYVALTCGGPRAKEIRTMRLGDLRLDEEELLVRSAKGGEAEVVPIRDEQTIRALDRYAAAYRIGPRDPDAPLFTTDRATIQRTRHGSVRKEAGTGLTKSGLRQIVLRIERRVGFDLKAHLFRHTWATNFRRSGTGDLEDLRREGRWRDERSIAPYKHVKPLAERRRMPSPLAAVRASAVGGAVKRSNVQKSALRLVRGGVR